MHARVRSLTLFKRDKIQQGQVNPCAARASIKGVLTKKKHSPINLRRTEVEGTHAAVMNFCLPDQMIGSGCFGIQRGGRSELTVT